MKQEPILILGGIGTSVVALLLAFGWITPMQGTALSGFFASIVPLLAVLAPLILGIIGRYFVTPTAKSEAKMDALKANHAVEIAKVKAEVASGPGSTAAPVLIVAAPPPLPT